MGIAPKKKLSVTPGFSQVTRRLKLGLRTVLTVFGKPLKRLAFSESLSDCTSLKRGVNENSHRASRHSTTSQFSRKHSLQCPTNQSQRLRATRARASHN